MKKLVLLATTLAPVTAWAHPGHGTLELSSARPVIGVLAAVIAAIVAWGWSRSRAERTATGDRPGSAR